MGQMGESRQASGARAPLTGGTSAEFEAEAARFLAVGGPPELGPALLAGLRRRIRSAVRSWRSRQDFAFSAEDIEQEVVLRLLANPPLGRGGTPAAVLLAWVGTTTIRLLTDYSRRPRERLAETGEPPYETLAPEPSPEDRVGAARQLATLRRVLERHYPTGLAVFDDYRQGQRTSMEVAKDFGMTSNNVDKIRSRIRWVLTEHESEWAADDRPENEPDPASGRKKQ